MSSDTAHGRRLYLDHAATSWPKSPSVLSAMHDYAADFGAAAGRGGYRSAQCAGEIVMRTRRDLARLIGADSPAEISFHASGTAALNAAILGFVRSADHVVTTASEHNSVLRPLEALRVRQGIDVSVVPCDEHGCVDERKLIEAIRPKTRLVAMTHASNVTGALQPMVAVAQHLLDRPTALLVDAAQTIGWLPIDVSVGIDFLAAPGHKALGGPFGTALLYTRHSLSDDIHPIIFGGTGTQSDSLEMPPGMPDKLEPGNLNVPAIAGLQTAVGELLRDEDGIARRAARGTQLSQQMHARLRRLTDSAGNSAVRVFGNVSPIPVVSFALNGYGVADVAAILDTEFSTDVRSGFHCAALIHPHLGSGKCVANGDTEGEGTVRASAGHDTSDDDIRRFLDAIEEIALAS